MRIEGIPCPASPHPYWLDYTEADRLSPDPVARRVANYVFAFHDGDEIGPRMLARIAKHTGLTPEDL